MSTDTAPAVTGHLLAIDAEQRRDLVAGACERKLILLGNTDAVWQVFRHDENIEIVDPGAAVTGDGIMVACALRSDPLPADEVKLITEHVAAGGEAIVDVVPSDPVIPALRAQLGDALLVRSQALLAISVMIATGDAPEEPFSVDPGGQPLSAHAHRVVVFAGEGVSARGSDEQVVSPVLMSAVPPSPDLARLDARVRELEVANQRLAQGRLGVHDAAAARAAAATTELSQARTRIGQLEEQLESAIFHARQNDELFQDARRQLLVTTAELRRHQVDPRALTKRALARVRNVFRPR